VDSVQDLLTQYPTNEYSPDKAAAKLTGKGYTKGADGFWANAGGHLKLEVGAKNFGDDALRHPLLPDTHPVLQRQLLR